MSPLSQALASIRTELEATSAQLHALADPLDDTQALEELRAVAS